MRCNPVCFASFPMGSHVSALITITFLVAPEGKTKMT